MLDIHFGFIWVVSSISTASLAASFTSVNWVRSQRVLHRRHHVYHLCARPSKSFEVHSVAFESIFINWKYATLLFFTLIDVLSFGQWLWLQGAAISAHICVATHISAISRRWQWNGLRFSHRHRNSFFMLDIHYGFIWVGLSHLALEPEHDDSVHKKCIVQYLNIPPVCTQIRMWCDRVTDIFQWEQF